MRLISPVTAAEFLHHLQRCIPPSGWPAAISVANSGGPDSTALLFLLTTVIRSQAARKEHQLSSARTAQVDFPQDVSSIHVNHNLQTAASAMEQMAVKTALKLEVNSIVKKIPWGVFPFPERPEDVAVGEKMARDARYNRVFAAMQELRTDVIAFAHHADDQVETTVMRMSQGSSTRGLAAMRPIRRWGMGQKDSELAAYGVEGMHKWIVRPFLNVPKERLLATCEANGLDYVNDPTNFHPGITVRNTIRHVLTPTDACQDPNRFQTLPLPVDTEGGLQFDVAPHVEKLRAMVPDVPPVNQLREAVRLYGIRLEETEMRVTNLLERCRIPSPPSTLLLNCTILSRVKDEELRTSLIRRALRYVSPGPWGSLWAEAGGGRTHLLRIADNLFRSPDSTHERLTFTAGADVIAIPVTILLDSQQARFRPLDKSKGNEAEGWLLARAPPYHRTASAPNPLHIGNASDGINRALREGKGKYSMLYDNRFLIEFNLDLLPQTVEAELVQRNAGVFVEPDTRWMLPKVVLKGTRTTARVIGKFLWDLPGWHAVQRRPVKFQHWMTLDFVRSCNAI